MNNIVINTLSAKLIQVQDYLANEELSAIEIFKEMERNKAAIAKYKQEIADIESAIKALKVSL